MDIIKFLLVISIKELYNILIIVFLLIFLMIFVSFLEKQLIFFMQLI
jgi:hypothetical protein